MKHFAVFPPLLISTLFLSNTVFSAPCPASSSAETSGANDGDNCTVTDGSTGTVIQLNFISGFDSATLIENDTAGQTATDAYYTSITGGATVSSNPTMPATAATASKASGNNGTTVGAQRKLAFIKAAEILASKLTTSVPIVVDAEFANNLFCHPSQATLGSASASSFLQNASAPAGALNSTWYPVGLYNSLSGVDNYPSGGPLNPNPNTVDNSGNINADSDVFARYNSLVGTTNCLDSSNGWYYGFDAPPTAEATDADGNSLPFLIDEAPPQLTYIGFTTVLLHEMLHGIGFSSLIHTDSNTGTVGSMLGGLPDVYSTHLVNSSGNKLVDMATDANRETSVKSVTQLLWDGTNTNTNAVGSVTDGYQDNDSTSSYTSGDKIQMYAPNPIEVGSSVSHFSSNVSPDEIMEPQYTAGSLDIGLALYLLEDLGWSIVSGSNTAPTISAVNQTTLEDTPLNVDVTSPSNWAIDLDGDSLSYTFTNCPTNLTCNDAGLTLTPATDFNGTITGIEITVDDGNGGTANDTFDLTVTAVNDVPVMGTISNLSMNLGSTETINLTSTDVDSGSVTYSVSGSSNAGASITGSTLTLTPIAAGSYSLTVTVDDGSLTDTETFQLTVAAAPSLALNGTALDTINSTEISLGDVSLLLADGASNYTISLTFEGQNANHLITSSGTNITIGMPSASEFNGQFAGEYTLTLVQKGTGASNEYSLLRGPRLNISASKLLSGNDSQILTIEGGAANTVYTLNEDNNLITFSQDNSTITTVTASDDAANFNPAEVAVNVTNVTALTNSHITADSIYATGSVDRDIYVRADFELTIEDSQNNRLTQSSATLISPDLSDFNLDATYSANNLGVIVIGMPDIGEDFTVSVSQTLYVSQDVLLVTSQLEQTVVLAKIATPLILQGDIEALSPLNYAQTLPSITLNLINGTSIDIEAVKISNSLARFEYVHDLNVSGIQNLVIGHSEGTGLSFEVLNQPGEVTFDIFLQASNQSPTIGNDDGTEIGSSAGSFGFLWLLLTMLWVFRLPKSILSTS